MNYEIIFDIAIMMVGGLLFGRLGKHIKLPNVTGYLVAGLIIGPYIMNILPQNMVDNFSLVSEMALGFIAFAVGSEFKLSYFKQVGATPIIIAATEAFGAVLLVMFSMILLGFNIKLSILLGAIAAATAPAQTIMVIQQYKAKGPLTSMLLSVVALDDAVALIVFGFAATLVKSMSSATSLTLSNLLAPIFEVILSFILGAVISAMMSVLLNWFHKPSNRICITISGIFFALWGANIANASPLLSCMALGAVLTNMRDDIDDLSQVINSFTPPIFMIFFVISGAGFDVGALKSIGYIGAVYIVMRFAGKWLGAWFGGVITKSDENICKYLGPTLMPQAGVAIGLILVAKTLAPEFAAQIQTVILSSTFIYSLIGPSVAKSALVKAGEIAILPNK